MPGATSVGMRSVNSYVFGNVIRYMCSPGNFMEAIRLHTVDVSSDNVEFADRSEAETSNYESKLEYNDACSYTLCLNEFYGQYNELSRKIS